MTKSQKIGLIVGLLILAGGGIATYLYLHKKKGENGLDPLTVDPDDIPESTKAKVGGGSTENDGKPMSKLKSDLAKAYYVMEILENKGGVVYNKKTGKPISTGLDNATWIQLKKRKNEIISDFKSTQKGSKTLGLDLVSKMNKDIDGLFDSSKYHTQTDWYKDYIKKYPEGIKGIA